MIIKIIKYLKRCFSDLSDLAFLICFGYPPPIIKFKLLWMVSQSLIYPLPRIFLGHEKASKICDSFLQNNLSPAALPLNKLSGDKIMVSGDPSHYQVFIEVYIKNLYKKEEIKEGMNIIDVGAHIGAYTLLAAKMVGKKGRVIAVEPEPQNYQFLLKNIGLNNFKNVIPKNLALGNKGGVEKLYLSHFGSASHSLSPEKLSLEKDESSFIEVPIKTLGELVSELNLNKIDIIKIDVEGTELSVLKGAEKTLKTNPKVKIFVASYHYPEEMKEITKFLNERGFKTKVWKGVNIITI